MIASRILAVFALFGLMILPLSTAPNDTEKVNEIIVNTLEDEYITDGDCSLREAIYAADYNHSTDECPPGFAGYLDQISFAVSGTIVLSSTLSLGADFNPVEIDGGKKITLSGNSRVRVLDVEDSANLILKNIRIRDGKVTCCDPINQSYPGGGLWNQGYLIIDNVDFFGNQADGRGGAIYNDQGQMTILNSTFSNNKSNYGGAIASYYGQFQVTDSDFFMNTNLDNTFGYGGAINSIGLINITGSTFHENSTLSSGGAIWLSEPGGSTIVNSTFSGNSVSGDYGSGGALTLANTQSATIINSTFLGNSATTLGQNIHNYDCTLTVKNSIFSNNTTLPSCSGAIIDGGHNLESGDSCGFSPVNGSIINTNPLLAPLANNHGQTLTHAVLAGSSAINTGNPALCPDTDQRGASRLDECDIGAYEFGGTITQLTSPASTILVGEPLSLTVSVLEADNGTPTGTVNISDQSLVVASGVLDSASQFITTVLNLTPGPHILTSSYLGNLNFGSSTDNLKVSVLHATTTTIDSISPTQSVTGEGINVHFTITSPTGIPTGTVTVRTDQASDSCSGTVTNNEGNCTLILNTTGIHSLTAQYEGTDYFQTSQDIQAHIVTKASTSTTIISKYPETSLVGQPVKINVSVSAIPPGGGDVTGVITVNVKGKSLFCLAAINAGSGNCELIFPLSGQYELLAAYSGSDNYKASTTAVVAKHIVTSQIRIPIVARGACQPIYQDDFSNPTSGWPIYEDANVRLAYDYDEYNILIKTPNYIEVVTPGFQSANFFLSTNIHRIGGQGSYGLVFGISDNWERFFTYEIDYRGRYGIFYYDARYGWDVLAYDYSAIVSGQDQNHLVVEVNGTTLNAYANDRPLVSLTDNRLGQWGRVGLTSSSFDTLNLLIKFDDFTVTTLPCPLASTPTPYANVNTIVPEGLPAGDRVFPRISLTAKLPPCQIRFINCSLSQNPPLTNHIFVTHP